MKLLAVIVACLMAALPLVAAPKENPVPVRTVKPDYPADLRSQGVSGLVMVKCKIDEQGNVTEVVVQKSSNEAFDKFALDALKKWKFKPARQDGAPVAVQVTIPVKFIAEET